jgi:hypothetical protein
MAQEPGSAAFWVGQGARIGNLSVGGNVAGRDITIGVTPADATAAQDRQQLLAVVAKLQAEVAALQDAPAGLRSDATDELRKASEAGEQGDTDRFVEKLATAQNFLERIGQAVPTALALAQTVAAVAARFSGLG